MFYLLTCFIYASRRSQKDAPVVPEIDFTQHVQDDGTVVSTVERVVKDVQAPAFYKPTDEQFFSREDPSKPDIAFLKNHFYREGRLTDDQGKLTGTSPAAKYAALHRVCQWTIQ